MIPAIAFSTFSTIVIASRFDSGYYNLIMMKGGNKWLYILGVYISDVIITAGTLTVSLAFTYFGNIRMEGFWVATYVFSFTNPLFLMLIVYWMQYAKRRTSRATLVLFGVFSALAYTDAIVIPIFAFISDGFGTGFALAKLFSVLPGAYLTNCGIYSFC